MAVDMFIKIGDIKGESRDKTHKEEIDVLAWSWGMSNSGSRLQPPVRPFAPHPLAAPKKRCPAWRTCSRNGAL